MSNTCYIGFSTDSDIRFRATSGGVGTAIIKYLLESRCVDYALTFAFDKVQKKYYPQLISDFKNYNLTASIYQEMDMQKFFRESLTDELEGKSIVVFSLPCQTPFIRSLAKRKGINVIIIGLTCSSQQKFDATKYLFKRCNIKYDDVTEYQYRGNGWPSGVQIKTINGKEHFIHNHNSIWTSIFHSRLFIPERCFKCQDTLNRNSDIVLADPWLAEYFESEKKGKSIFMPYTEIGQEIVTKIISNLYVEAEVISSEKLYLSQIGTIKRKEGYKKHPKRRDQLIALSKNKICKRLIIKYTFFYNLYIRIKDKLENKMK